MQAKSTTISNGCPRKFGEPTTQRIGMPRGLADVDGLIATWGKVALEPLDSTAIKRMGGWKKSS